MQRRDLLKERRDWRPGRVWPLDTRQPKRPQSRPREGAKTPEHKRGRKRNA